MPSDPQYIPDNHVIRFEDVALIVLRSKMSSLLDDEDFNALAKVSPVFHRSHWHFLPSWLPRPASPHLKRRFGFGAAEVGRSTAHVSPNPLMAVHFAWNFLDVSAKGCAVQVHSCWNKYARLRADAVVTPIHCLHEPRPWIDEKDFPTQLNPKQAQLHSLVLLRFDFLHGDVVRWLGGEYTNSHRKFDQEWVKILEHMDGVPPPELPPVNPIATFRAQTTGVPLKGQFVTSSVNPAIRDTYDNHPAVAENLDKVEKKFAKEEWKRYHIHYLRWLFPFLFGLIISPIQWVFDKGKGRICIDCTNGPPDKGGSVNTYIPKPFNVKKVPKGTPPLDYDECPPTYFKHAFKRVIRRILRMRITRPTVPILVHTDDIDAAFRRILYHPDLAIAFAYFFEEYLIVPISQVFGGRSSPPFYGLFADTRESLAVMRPCDAPEDFHPLVKSTTITVDTSSPLTPIPRDSHHPPLTDAEAAQPFQASYVDDMATVAYPDKMAAAVDNSVKAAFEVFGPAESDRRGDCLQMDKWESEVSETFLFLGFEINTHNMTITWPLFKRQRLYDEIAEVLARPHPRYVSPKEMSHLVGVVWSASEVAPWGKFLSFNLQNALTTASRNAKCKTNRRWYSKSRIYLSKTAVATLKQLNETLLCEDGITWTRPMALFFDREFTHHVFSDASYIGIGGWSPDFNFLWRVTRDDLVRLGFDMKHIDRQSSEPTGLAPGLHINPLEYIAALINLWLSLVAIMDAGPRAGGYILQLNADNTTALAWMSEAARTPNPFLQGLARLGSALLVAAARLLTKVVPTHIPGKQNSEADALSRPINLLCTLVPSLDSVIAQWPNLRMCQIYLLPTKLLRIIADAKEFVTWCEVMCFTEYSIRELTDAQCVDILGTYVSHVGAGWNCKNKLDLSAQSLRNYVRAAHRVLELWLGRSVPIYDSGHMGKQPRFHPFISQQISDRRTWERKKAQKLPLTRDMFVALAKHLAQFGVSLDMFLGAEYCVYDWLRLGVFTGFRVSEYAQAKVTKGFQFLAIPDTSDVPADQRGQPLAFVISDFTFYTADLIEISHSRVVMLHRRRRVRFVELCWRFDKSANNFVIRRYALTGDDIFDPVDAAVNIVHRAQLLKIPPHEPLGAWRTPNGRPYRFLRDNTITMVMRQACVLAYPDPNHFYRRNIKSLVTHCVRVTAAYVMKLGGAENDEIAHSKRWHPTSVPTYLRDGFESAHVGQNKTLRGLAATARPTLL